MAGKLIFKNIGFCTDFSENSGDAFEVALTLAEQFGATIHVIHVLASFSLAPPVHATYMPIEYDPKFIEEVTEAARKTIDDKYISRIPEAISTEVSLTSGYAATEIIRIAQERKLDLIVMGAHGLTGLAHVLFGSTADRVVRRAPCSVLAVRARK